MSEEEREEYEEEFPEQIEEILTGFRDALQKNSEEEQAVAMFEVYEEMTEGFFMSEDLLIPIVNHLFVTSFSEPPTMTTLILYHVPFCKHVQSVLNGRAKNCL